MCFINKPLAMASVVEKLADKVADVSVNPKAQSKKLYPVS